LCVVLMLVCGFIFCCTWLWWYRHLGDGFLWFWWMGLGTVGFLWDN